MRQEDTLEEKLLKLYIRIFNRLWWIALWLFIIAMIMGYKIIWGK